MLSFALVLLIRLPSVQTFAVHKAASYFSDEWQTKVEIKHIDIEFLKKIVVEGIYIEDKKGDTLLYADKLKADIGVYSLLTRDKKLEIKSVELVNGHVELKRYKDVKGLNFKFIEDYFASDEKTTDSAKFEFNIEKIKLTETRFYYQDLRWEDYTRAIDWEDIRLINVNADISDLFFKGDTVLCSTENLRFKEYKGFVVNKFASHVKIAPGHWGFDDLHITTPFSDVSTQLSLDFDSIEQFDDFENFVRMKSSFEKSTLSSNDLQYFAEELFGLDQTISLKGRIRGTVSSLKGRELEISFGKSSLFKGDAGLTGLPNIEETFLNLKIDKLVTSKEDIETIKTFPFDSSGYIQLPENLSRLGNVTFSGTFTGFYNDFVTYGNIQTAIGYLSTDVNLKFNPDLQKSSYSGKMIAKDFDFGIFWNSTAIGKASFDAKISGTGFQSSKVAATLEGNISSITLNNYVYHNIELDGDIARKLFSGDFSIDEPNLKLEFEGSVDFRNKLPIFDFSTTIERAYISKLNFVKRDSSAQLSAKVSLNMQGLKFDELDGYILVENLQYKEKNKDFGIGNILYSSSKIASQRLIKLNSEVIDAELKGDFRLVNIEPLISTVLNKYMPSVVYNKKLLTNNRQQLAFEVNVKKVNDVLDVFVPGLSVSGETKASGEINSGTGLINIGLNAPYLSYEKYTFDSIRFFTKNEGSTLNSILTVDRIKAGDSLVLTNNSITASVQREKASVDLKILNTDSSGSRIEIFTREEFLSDRSIVLRILPSAIKVENQNWSIDEGNTVRFDSTGILVNQLSLGHDNQSLRVNGKISKNPADILNIAIGQFNISVLNQLLSVYDVSVGGITNGTIKLSSLLAKPIAETDLRINQLCYYGDTLGDATMLIKYLDNNSKIDFNCFVENRGKKEIIFDGYYQMKPVNDEMDFNIKVTRINGSILTRYLTSFTSEFRGIVSGDLRLSGLAKAPVLTGKAKIQKGSMLIDYLNTKYFFTAENVTLNEGYIDIPDLEINDKFNNKGMIDARVYHNSFSDFVFDVKLVTSKLYCLNTNAKQNELFYGTAFASGICDITGTENLVNFDISLRSLEGTVINIPLSSAENVVEKDFITFISDDTLNKVNIKKEVDLSGINLDLKLEATPAAQVKLIFDEKIGDEMTGSGYGTLRMKITPAGEFNMFGDYTIEKGDYLFTMQNVINKRFNIDNGGIIRWSGNPYDAEIDISARYKNLRASTYDLLQDTSNRKRIPVELSLRLTGNLFNPNVKFSIEVPGLDASLQNQLNSRLSSDQELNRQVFSLLVLNRFSPPEEGRNGVNETGSSNSVGSNVGELLSNQVTNWLSKLSKDVNIGVNYRPGDELNRKDEFEVSLSTELFNDRVSIDGSFGVNNNNNSGSASNVVGDFNVEFKASSDGRLRLRAFNKTNTNSYINYLNSQYTQGIGVFYREEFNSAKDLFAIFRERREKKEKKNKTSMR